jgi:CBS domain-containing protein
MGRKSCGSPLGYVQGLRASRARANRRRALAHDVTQGTFPAFRSNMPELVETLPSAAQTTTVTEAMAHSVICASPDAGIRELLQLFVDHGISGVPVVDPAGHPLGVVSQRDVLRELRESPDAARPVQAEGPDQEEDDFVLELLAQHATRRCARHIMTPLAVFVPKTASIARAAAIMAYEHIHRVLVVDEDHTVVGLVSSLDVMRWLARQDGYAVP